MLFVRAMPPVNTASDKVDNLMNIPVGDEMLLTEDIPVVSNVDCASNAIFCIIYLSRKILS